MESIYKHIRSRARQIVAQFPQPDFYKDFAEDNETARGWFFEDPIVSRLRGFVEDTIENDFGHGLKHAVKVALDAGALVLIEGRHAGYPQPTLRRSVRLVHCAGLLHDIRRRDDRHAEAGAAHARKVLRRYPFSADEIVDICTAIQNHEAFTPAKHIDSPKGLVISDCLYDADKFRWGPDNFTDTVWAMVSFYNPPLAAFIQRYPQGMQSLKRIRDTFRSETGIKYGPQFIDMGLSIGQRLYQVILAEFSDHI